MALTDNEMARLAYEMANAEAPTPLPEDKILNAEFWVGRARIYLKARYTYNPDVTDTDVAEHYYVEYAKLKLLGVDPHNNREAQMLAEMWAKSAALTHYDQHPDGYPDFPEYRKRIRGNSTKKWNP